MAGELPSPKTKPKEDVLASYNEEHGSNLTFAELGAQLAMKELQAHNRKMLRESVIEEVLV